MKKLIILIIPVFLLSFILISEPWKSLPPAPKAIQEIADSIGIDLQEPAQNWLKHMSTSIHSDNLYYLGYLSYDVMYYLVIYSSDEMADLTSKDRNRFEYNGTENSDIIETTTFRKKFLYAIYKDNELQEEAYNWIMPVLKQVVANNKKLKWSHRLTVDHLLAYCDYFDLDFEKAFYEKCNMKNSGLNFTYHSPYTRIGSHDYRVMETWIYRRVLYGDMTIEEIKNWFLRIKKDLEL